ncbi:hypothetical protein [Streptomyces sp. CBMA123]|uniref:hypothetical protein n=1 Tax=Streptomyces sp. CBMA123 TaxID=1896313 RepID=UPI003983313D
MTGEAERGVPAGVLAAERAAARLGFTKSCTREVGRLRLRYLTHPALEASEVLTTPGSSAVLAVRRA